VSRVTPPAGHRGAVLAGLIMVLLLAALDGTIVATALPTIVAELGGLAHLAWVVSAYLLAQTAVIPLYGKLGDLYGPCRAGAPGRRPPQRARRAARGLVTRDARLARGLSAARGSRFRGPGAGLSRQ
jgi:MFS family permease